MSRPITQQYNPTYSSSSHSNLVSEPENTYSSVKKKLKTNIDAEPPKTPFDQRKVEPALNGKIVCQRHEQIVRSLITEQISEFDVDEDSVINMAEALMFAGVDTIECANAMNLQIIPPGPVFYTWYALKGTSLFDGVNNECKFNYVKQLDEQATRLAEWDIPVIVIYTQNSMTNDQVLNMDSIFANHQNIIVLNIEKDLSNLPISKRFLIQETGSRYYLDGLRFEVLMDFQSILSEAKLQACHHGKKEVSNRLDKWKNKSITYMDMDNYFLRKPFFQIAPNGFLKTYSFSGRFRLNEIENVAKKSGVVLPDNLIESSRKQVSLLKFTHVFDKDPLVDEVGTTSEYLYHFVINGEAEKVWRSARNYLPNHLSIMNSSWPDLFVPWNRDCNFYMAKIGFQENIPHNIKRIGPASENEQNPIHCYDLEDSAMPLSEFKEKAIRLGGLQQIKCIYIGLHKSFLSKSMRATLAEIAKMR